jgi:two-component system LytT family sensor kinase
VNVHEAPTGVTSTERARSRWARLHRFVPTWVALIAAAIVVDLAMVAAYVHLSPGEIGRSLAPSFPLSYKNWLMWAALAPAIILLVHTMVAQRWFWGKRIGASLALAGTLALAHAVIELELHRLDGGAGMAAHASQPFLAYHLFHGLLTFCVLYAVALLIESDRSAHERGLREVQLQEQVSRAQLHTLRMQLQPHFLFNTLNSVSALVEQDVRGGQRMLSRLSDFLRMTLASSGHQEVPLRDELKLLETYVEIERIRFGDRLRIVYDVAPEVQDALVPNLILQPLVENAIRHGIHPSLAGGTVTVRAYREADRLILEVADDGVGFNATAGHAAGTGVGLANTRERLRQRYGAAAELQVTRRAPGGTAVIQRLPFISDGDCR